MDCTLKRYLTLNSGCLSFIQKTPLVADPLRGAEWELFEEGWKNALHSEEDVVGRKTNRVHIETGVDLKAI